MAENPIQRAITAAGSVSALAKALGIAPQAISQWRRVPADRAKLIETAFGIPRHELRPDLWDAPGKEAA